MKGLRKLFIFLLFFLTLQTSNTIYASRNVDLFNEISKATEGEIAEAGFKACFEVNDDAEKVCNSVYSSLSISDSANRTIYKNGSIYCINFAHNAIEGYIESMLGDNHSIVTISVNEKTDTNNLENLKSKVEEAVISQNKKPIFFQYIKLKVSNRSLSELNYCVLDILKARHAGNIETVKISNGYSTVANTGNYKPINVMGKSIDFNFSVCTYKDESYIIMGTPEIYITY